MLYRKNGSPSLAKELFQNPTSEYRGAPFWSWNCKVNKEDIDHTLEDLHTMGMGGAHIHCRTSLILEKNSWIWCIIPMKNQTASI